MKSVDVGGIHILYDPKGGHDEDCNWQHGGLCNCRPEMVLAAATRHCHECDFVNNYSGSSPCSCKGFCVCDREHGCPCIDDELRPRVYLV